MRLDYAPMISGRRLKLRLRVQDTSAVTKKTQDAVITVRFFEIPPFCFDSAYSNEYHVIPLTSISSSVKNVLVFPSRMRFMMLGNL